MRCRSAVVFAVASLAAFAFALPRVGPTVALVGDSGELVAAGYEWGVPHAPGFPLYTFLLHLATRVPLHEVAWRANVTSALFHALVVGLLALLTLRLTSSVAAAATSGLVLALAPSFGFASLYAEVFPLSDLFLAVLLVGALSPRDATPEAATRSSGTLTFLATVAGAASAHHPLIVFCAPALFVALGPTLRLLLPRAPRRAASLVALFGAAFVASYALTLIAAARSPFLSWGDVHDAAGLVRLVARVDYGGAFATSRTAVEPDLARRVETFGRLLVEGFGPTSLALAGAGAVLTVRRSPRVGVALVLAFLLPGPGFALLNTLFQRPDAAGLSLAARFLTLSELPLAVLAGLAVAAALGHWPRLRALPWLLPALVAAPLVPAATRLTLRDDRRGAELARDLLHGTTDGSLVLLTGDVAIQSVSYACVVERACGTRTIVAPGMLFLDWYHRQLARLYPALAVPKDLRSIQETHRLIEEWPAERPVFVSPHVVQRDPELAVRFDLLPTSLLLEVHRREDASEAARAFLVRAERLAEGDDCEGCREGPPAARPRTLEPEAALTYAAALENHAAAARRLGRPELAAPLHLRALALAPPGPADGAE